MKEQGKFNVINFSRQDVPIVLEDIKTRYQWVPIGILDQDDYFGLLTEAYTTSTTNAACIDGVADLVYGKGSASPGGTFQSHRGLGISATT